MYTRVYAESSPRQLISGKGRSDRTLSIAGRQNEFRLHSNFDNEEPTAFVSVSSRIIDTLNRAYKLYYDYNEPAENVRIVFIRKPAHGAIPVKHAEKLAEECKYDDSGKFKYEYLFQWYIPEDLVDHTVSLETLLARGLDWHKNILEPWKEPTPKLKARIASKIWRIENMFGFREVGIYLGCFASLFGARADLYWIATQLFDDCFGENRIKRCNLECRDSECCNLARMYDGIDTILVDLFTHPEFITSSEIFAEERDEIEQEICEKLEGFNDAWGYEELSQRDRPIYIRALAKMHDEIDHLEVALEKEAVKIGL
ncbi:hypothetical protein E8E14_003265 [Neopestalotiopsis sp. 37M]|nr:hypothetical protein E8E14_003265 [Neopestalotiopsis sp. 37M]